MSAGGDASGRTGHADLVVLGGGSGGYAAALRAAELGRSVVLIEQDRVGGTCLHRGCIPTKALLHAAEVADTIRDSATFGIRSSLDAVDMPGIQKYKSDVVGKSYRGLAGLVRSRGIRTVEGSGRLVGPREVRVGDTTWTADHVILATGSRPRLLPGVEVDGTVILTSEDALALDHVPASAIVLGGGVIGVEFASAWRSLGAAVTVVEALPNLVPLEDESSSVLLERAFRRRGVELLLGRRMAASQRTATGVRVTLDDGTVADAEVLLVAVGRVPVSEGLGYEEQGVTLAGGYVVVDDLCRTAVPGISAVGDLIATPQLAHVGFAEGILSVEHAAGLDVVPIDYRGVPRVTYCSPEVASVGYTEREAVDKWGADGVRSVVYDLAGNGKSAILRTRGAVKVVARTDGPVVGLHLVGDRVGELAAEAQLVYNWAALPGEVAQLIHPHPTQSEAIGEAHLLLAGKPLHVHG